MKIRPIERCKESERLDEGDINVCVRESGIHVVLAALK